MSFMCYLAIYPSGLAYLKPAVTPVTVEGFRYSLRVKQVPNGEVSRRG
jgi:hypothetical protein